MIPRRLFVIVLLILAAPACTKARHARKLWPPGFVEAAGALLGGSPTLAACEKKCPVGDCAETTDSDRGRWICIIPCERDDDCPASMVCNCGSSRSLCDTPLMGTTATVCVVGARASTRRHDAGADERERLQRAVTALRRLNASSADAGGAADR